MPCLSSPAVATVVPSTSRYATSPSRSRARPVRNAGRTELTASINATMSASLKRRRKSPTVVGSGNNLAPSPFINGTSFRSRSTSSSRIPPVSTL